MKNRFDASAIQATIQRALAAAGLDTTSGALHGVTQTLRRALGGEVAQPGSQAAAAMAPGTFERHEFSNRAGTRTYKLYEPPRLSPRAGPRAMVVMLHGCTQSADDFAAGTRMNRLADEQGFLVVYPEQASSANPSRCWNWFNAEDQARGGGEPSLIAGIASEVAARHGVDPRRIFVAGLSAGAAMAVILGQTYPDLFAAVGAHSGLPYGSAHDLPSAMAAMKGGRSGIAGVQGLPLPATAGSSKAAQAVPTIVFHGDRDHTVQHSNGAAIAQQAAAAYRTAAGDSADHWPWHTQTLQGTAPGGRRYSRSVQSDASGQPLIESWTLHGAGHAWSGGDASGSYTDGSGPDASAEMLRFFLALPRSADACTARQAVQAD
jgi:poly(hydroxyalkanoate) depolymerase family esterase